MRTLAALSLLLLVVLAGASPAAAAEDSPSPSPSPPPLSSPSAAPLPVINPICAQAFIGAEPAPSSPAETSAPEMPDAVTAAPDRLDAAIAACASVEDWAAGAQLYPGALQGANATALLLERCIDPSAGLGVYATCRSLADALAAAAPTPSPSLAPSPTLAPTLAPTLTAAPSGNDEKPSTREPGTPQPGADGLVRLPRKLGAKVAGATSVRYFAIGGRTASTLLKQTLKRAIPRCGIHRAIACVNMSWRVQTTQSGGSESCTITDVGWTLTSTVHLPRWTRPNRVDPALLQWWRKVLKQSATHEARHIKIQKAELARMRRQLIGRSCSSFGTILKRTQRRSSKAQAAFDRRQSTKPLPPAP